MAPYVQTNESGYVTGVVDEPLLLGLFGGKRTMQVTDEEASAIKVLLEAQHQMGEGLHISRLESLKPDTNKQSKR